MVAARLIGMVADWIADDPRIPHSSQDALRATVVSIISAKLSAAFGGEELRLYVPREPLDQRRARDERIALALSAGEHADAVARRERVSDRHVRRVRGRIGPAR